jgi:Tol biopolymer transport system component
MEGPRLSSDGARMAFTARDRDGEASHVHTYDVARRSGPTQVTFEGLNRSPLWSTDGTRLVYASARDDGYHLDVKAVDGTAPPTRLLEGTGEATEWACADNDGVWMRRTALDPRMRASDGHCSRPRDTHGGHGGEPRRLTRKLR